MAKKMPTEGFVLEQENYRGSGYQYSLRRYNGSDRPVTIMSAVYNGYDKKFYAYVDSEAIDMLDPLKAVPNGRYRLAANDAERMMQEFEKVLPTNSPQNEVQFGLKDFTKHSLYQFAKASARESINKNDAYVSIDPLGSDSYSQRITMQILDDNHSATIIFSEKGGGKKDRRMEVYDSRIVVADIDDKKLAEITDPKLAKQIRDAVAGVLADGRLTVKETDQIEQLARQAVEKSGAGKGSAVVPR